MEKYRLVQEHKASEQPSPQQQQQQQQRQSDEEANVPTINSSSTDTKTTPTTTPPPPTTTLSSDQLPNTKQQSSFPEVRITQQGKPRNYISYAMVLFDSGNNTIVLKAMGRAINKAVTIAEILKRKMPLHQQNSLSSVEMIDVYEPVEEGLDIVTSKRYVSCMMITLSRTAVFDPTHLGYQPPLPVSDMHPEYQQQHGSGSIASTSSSPQQQPTPTPPPQQSLISSTG